MIGMHSKKQFGLALLIVLITHLAVYAAESGSQTYSLSGGVGALGGGDSQSSSYSLKGSATGEPALPSQGALSSSSYNSQAGFLVQSAEIVIADPIALDINGFNGKKIFQPGQEVALLRVGLRGDGASTLDGVRIIVDRMATGAEIDPAAFSEYRLYSSSDNQFDTGDTQIGRVSSVSLTLGQPVSVVTSVEEVVPVDGRYYFLTTLLSDNQVDQRSFCVGFPESGLAVGTGSLGSAIDPGDASTATVDVVATQLVFTTQPSGSVSGAVLSGQPVVQAQDAHGNLDVDFSEQVTLTEASAGTLAGNAMQASQGVATFAALQYTATVDKESFTLTADDQGSVGTDLQAGASAAVVSDVVATRLVFTTQPSGSVSGAVLSGQPVVQAQDAQGVVDVDFSEQVTLTETSAGVLVGNVVSAAQGVATFTALQYTATADKESFTLTADDQGSVGTDLEAGTSAVVVSDAVATRLVFTTQPAGAMHDALLGGQPVVQAQDAGGLLDVDFAGAVTLSAQPVGALTNNVATASGGVASFTQVEISTAGAERTLQAASDGLVTGTSQAFTVERAPATVTFTGLEVEYNGTPRNVGADTQPPNLSNVITYDGQSGEPVGPGTFTVESVVTDPNYVGSSTASFTITPAGPATISLSASPSQGAPPLEVTLTPSIEGYTAYVFLETKDSSGKAVENPSGPVTAVYSQPGTYEAVLTVTAPGGARSSTTTTITVFSPPKLKKIEPATANEDSVLVLDLSSTDISEDKEGSTWSVSDTDEKLIEKVEVDGNEIRFTPHKDAFGPEDGGVKITRTSRQGLSSSQVVDLIWNPVDDPPLISPPLQDAFEVAEDLPLVVTGTGHAVDIDSELETLLWEAADFDTGLVARVVPSQSGVTFEPVANAVGETPATILLRDPQFPQNVAKQAVTLSWTPVNDPPLEPVLSFPPPDGEEISLNPQLSWDGEDPDEDPLVFDLFLGEDKVAEGLSQKSYGLANLKPSTTYLWKVVARDPDGESSESSASFTTQADLLPPVVSDLQISSSHDRVTFSFRTSEPAICAVDLQIQEGEVIEFRGTEFGLVHTVTVEELEGGSFYRYDLRAKDESGNLSEPVEGDVLTLKAPDLIPPKILSGPVEQGITASQALLVWTTDELSTYTLRFAPVGEDLSGGGEVSSAVPSKSHQATLTDLEPDTEYQWELVVADVVVPQANAAEAVSGSFLTDEKADIKAPVFTVGPTVLGITQQSAILSFTADEPIIGQVRYGVDPMDMQSLSLGRPQTQHQVELVGLDPGIDYIYILEVSDLSENEREVEGGFTTREKADELPPRVLVGPTVLGLSDVRASVSLKTSEMALVTLRLSEGEEVILNLQSSALQVDHLFELTNLEPSTAYTFSLQAVDGVGNEAEAVSGAFTTLEERDIAAPQFVVRPSVQSITDQVATIVWETNELADSRVRYGKTADLELQPIQLPAMKQEHQVTLTNLEPMVQYFFEVSSQDASKNLSEGRRGTFTTLREKDETPPLILTGPVVEGITDRSATLTLTTDEGALLELRYGIDAEGETREHLQEPKLSKHHRMQMIDLQAGADYVFTLLLTDASGNTTEAEGQFSTRKEEDLTPPQFVQLPAAVGVTRNRANIIWKLNEAASGEIEYSTQEDLSQALSNAAPEPRKNHSVQMTNLEAGTAYYFRVKVKDAAKNAASSGISSFTTLEEIDENPPVVLVGPVAEGINLRSASIRVHTDEPASAVVSFTAEEGEALRVDVPELAQIHEIRLTNLEPATTYRYVVHLQDAQENAFSTPLKSFTTLEVPDEVAPLITSTPAVGDGKSTQVTVNWRTNEPGDSQVRFGLDASYGEQIIDPAYVKDHTVTLTNLQPGTTYHYSVLSTDMRGNGPTASDDFSFVTLEEEDLKPPAFVRMPIAQGVTDRAVTLSFATDEPARVRVEYGFTDQYEIGNLQFPELTTEHEMSLVNLEPEKNYLLRIQAWDALDNGPTTFAGLAVKTLKQKDEQPPNIVSGPIVISTTTTEGIVEWFTDELSDSGVEVVQGDRSWHFVDPKPTLQHTLVVSGLEPGQIYTYSVASTDGSNNGPTTAAGGQLKTQSEADRKPPQILSGPVVSNVGEDRATIRYETDEPANTVIEYGQTRSYGQQVERGDMTQVHEVTLTGLEAGVEYHFKVSSHDIAGNGISTDPSGGKLHSADHTFATRAVVDDTPPVFLLRPVVEATNKTAVMHWETNEETSARLEWAGGGERFVRESNRLQREHSFTLTHLKPRTAYVFRVTVQDVAGNSLIWGASEADLRRAEQEGLRPKEVEQQELEVAFLTSDVADVVSPVIVRGPQVIEKTISSMTVEWETDELADSFVRFGTTPELTQETGRAQDTNVHRITLTNLEPGQQYYFAVSSTDPSGNGPSESLPTVASTAQEVDLIPPSFVGAPELVSNTDDMLKISWQTDEACAVQVSYATADEEPLSLSFGERKTEHMITLTGLRADTDYSIDLRLKDASQNESALPEPLVLRTAASPDEEAPVFVRTPEILSVADRSVRIVWATDEPSESEVRYGVNPYMGQVEFGRMVEDEQLVERTGQALSHEVVLTRLEPGKDYFYRVQVIDQIGNGPNQSEILTFQTLAAADSVAPDVPLNIALKSGWRENYVHWEPSSAEDLTGYNVYRASGGDSIFVPIATRISEPEFIDRGLEEGATYRYRVTALDRATPPNESRPSEVAEGSPGRDQVASAPTPLRVEEGDTPEKPVLIVENAQAVDQEALTYIFQVSSTSAFADIVARGGGIDSGIRETGWDVAYPLSPDETYWWRARAFDGLFTGPWSEAASFRPSDAVAPQAGLVGDFNQDGIVDFADFFIFADAFGSDDSLTDIDGSGQVDFADFFIFADTFGSKSASAKTVSALPPAPEGALTLKAENRGSEVFVDLRMAVEDSEADGYGGVLNYDTRLLRFVGTVPVGSAASGDSMAAPIQLLREEYPGLLLIGAHRLSGKDEQELSTRFRFELLGWPEETEFTLSDGVVSLSDGRMLAVLESPTVRLLPEVYALAQNYPNPFNAQTIIPIAVPPSGVGADENAELKIFNMAGQLVRDLSAFLARPGYRKLVWDGRDGAGRSAASGVYIVRLEAEGTQRTRKLLLLR